MSASKLEKTVVNLEKRLKQEFHAEMQRELKQHTAGLEARLSTLEAQLKKIQTEPLVVCDIDRVSDIVEERLDRGDLNLPEAHLALEAKESVAPLELDAVAPEGGEVWNGFEEVEKPMEHTPEEEEVEEPVAFTETAWNLVLVLGLTGSGTLDACIACLLLICSAAMQITFSVILFGEEFLGEPFHEQIDMAKAWRRSVAHDHRHMDLAQTSLASRVCNGDGKLILSTDQASLLTQINAFVGLGHEDFELPWLQPGILLCMLCILLWCLYLCNELRAVFFSLEAVSFLPRGSRTILKQGRFIQMSYPRWLAYCLMRLARLSIAVALLYAGVLWLAGTTSITDLILNAVALSATLQVDEMIFAALMPKKIQINIQDLEAIKVKYSNARSQFESVVLLLLITGLMLWPYFSLVAPLAQDMLEVKRQYCAGNQDFVVGGNNMQKITVGFKTKPFNISEENSLSQFAVEDWIWRQDETVSNYILFKKELGEFDQQLSMPLSTLASFENTCEDWDATFLKGGTTESWQEQYRTHWFSTAFSLNMDLDSNCSEMRQHCDREDAGLLRYTCGHTCGCAYPYGNPWFRVTDSGCSDACKDAAEDYAATQICEDQNVTSQPLQDVWMTFWWYYLFMITYGVGLAHPNDLANNNQYADLYWRSLNMTELGCAGFLRVGWGEDPFLQSAFCEGSYVYRPLALLCPVSCGCTVSDPMPSYCPRSCKGCADGEEFPPQGQVTNCAQAAAVGLCEAYPAEALQLCAETCDLCHLLPGGARRLDSSRIAAVLQELDARARGGV